MNHPDSILHFPKNLKTTNQMKEVMNKKFDELTKSMAQSVTRRAALKKFGIGLAGMALACFGLAGTANAASGCGCVSDADCGYGKHCISGYGACCPSGTSGSCCCQNGKTHLPKCSPYYSPCTGACSIGA